MTEVEVVWITYHEGTIIRRGYWDQGLLEHLFSHQLWKPVRGRTFVHRDHISEVEGEGAVVVVPARWHASNEDVNRLNTELSALKWVLLILTGDEESIFPWRQIHHDNIKFWVQTPDPTIHKEVDRKLGDYWPPDVPNLAHTARKPEDLQTSNWFYSGQVNNEQRRSYVAEMVRRRQKHRDGEETATVAFGSGLPRREYIDRLALAKAAPCPSGIYTPDTFRLFEALEAGCVPIAESSAMKERTDSDTCSSIYGWYWPFLWGENPPYPVMNDVSQFNVYVDAVVDDFPSLNNKVFAWWQQKKREISYWMVDDLNELTGSTPHPQELSDKITVLIPTSAVPANPGYDHIVETIQSVCERLGSVEIIIMIDGLHPQQENRRADYEEYIRRLLWLTNGWHNVVPIVFEEHQHQANMTRRALELVKTPTILFVEHDTPLVGESDWAGLIKVAETQEANIIRLHHEASILEPHKHLMLDEKPQDVMGVPLMRTVQWSQRPHVANTEFYRQMIANNFGVESRTMIEDVMYGVLYNNWRIHKVEGWNMFRVFIYTPEGPDIKRSTHSDARGDDPKYEMKWAYDNGVPEGAPNPR